MTCEYSCGAVVFTRIGGEPRYLLVREKTGHWGCCNTRKHSRSSPTPTHF